MGSNVYCRRPQQLIRRKTIRLDNPVSELTCLKIYPREFSLLLITSTCNNRLKCTICTRVYLFPFFVFAPGCKLPHSLLLSRSHVKTICSYVANNQTNNHGVIFISTFCLQICNWQRQSSVTSVNRALLPIWILYLYLSARTLVKWLVHRPSNQDIPRSNLAAGIYLSFLLT